MFEGFFDGSEQLGRFGSNGGIEFLDDVTFGIHEKFGEVPFHGSAFFLEKFVERRGAIALDGDFGVHGESDVVFAGAELLNFRIGAGLLATEVVGGEAEDDEALVFVFFVEGLEAGVLRGVAALAGDVDDQQDFAFVGGEGFGLAVDAIG